MTIYEKNLQAIKKVHSYMYAYMDKSINSKSDKINNIHSVVTKDKRKALIVEIDEKVYRLNSSYKPLIEANKWVEQFNISDTGMIVLMFGLGNGVIVRKLIKKMTNKEMLIIYEPSKEIFMHVVENYDISDILENERVYIEVEDLNDNDFSKILNQKVNWINMYLQLFCIHPKYDEMFPESKQKVIKTISDSNHRAIIHRNTESHFAGIFTSNTINNIRFIKESNTIEELKRVFSRHRNIPAIIVSAGPSLDKNIDELRRAKGKAVIIAVDTSVRYLMKKDIIPDITITVDPNNPPNYYNDERAKCIPMIIRSESNYEITSWHTGKKIFFEGHEYFDCLYNELNKEFPIMSAGGSVSTAAFAVCSYIEFEKIILMGQDLAYLDGYTHAGNISDRDISENSTDDMFIEDIYGNQIKTRHDWYHYLTWLNDSVSIVNSKGREVIDATEGGAKIKGTKIISLSKAIDLYCNEEINVDFILNSMTPLFNKNEDENIKSYVQRSLNDLDIINQKASSSVEICEKLIKGYNEADSFYISDSVYNKELTENSLIIEKLPVNHLLNTYIATIATKELLNIYKIEDNEDTIKIKPYMIAREINKAKKNKSESIKHMLSDLLDNL